MPIEEFSQGEGEDALRITRQGETYVVTGSLDLTGDETAAGARPRALTAIRPRSTSARSPTRRCASRSRFPGAVISSNGAVDGNTVVWEPAFGEVVEIQAVAERGSTFPWSLVAAGALIAGLLLVGGFLAVSMRRGKAAPAVALPEGSIVPGAAMQPAGVAACADRRGPCVYRRGPCAGRRGHLVPTGRLSRRTDPAAIRPGRGRQGGW